MRFEEPLKRRLVRHLEDFERRPLPLEGKRPAAVAALVTGDEDGRACFVLTIRAALHRHSGQFALPGGRVDPGETPEEAACRELEEEVGLRARREHVLGLLDDYPTRSGFVITPVVLWWTGEADLRPDPDEVAEVYRVPLDHLDRHDAPHLTRIPESDRPVLSLPLLGTELFSPTAAILYQLREVGLHGRDTRVAHYEQPTWAWR